MENTQIGPFKIGSRLGSNRRQKVYRAKQVEQDLDVALKFIGLPDGEKRQVAIDKVQIEVELLKKLDHPNLINILGAGIEGDQIFFASELVKGESLTSMLSRRDKLAADQVVEYGLQVAKVLHYLHGQKILHAKLTPDKILVARDGKIKISDLRLNRSRKRRWDSSRKRELDIAAYMAPEQFIDGATEKSDIYALGVILYEMLTGKLPYEPDTMGRMTKKKMTDQAPPISSHSMNCPVWLDKIVCQMISPDPRRRPHTAQAIMLSMDELRILDKTKKSAVSQVSGAFTPLTAGKDKTEANRLLGKKDRPESDTPLIQSTGFLVVGLFVILSILVFAMLPASSKQNFEAARQLMQSNEAADWREARHYLNDVIAKGTNDDYFTRAEQLYFESRRRTLVNQAERGRILGIQSPATKKFIRAVQSQSTGGSDVARKALNELVDSVAPHGDERHIHTEAKMRVDQIIDSIELPTQREALTDLIDANQNHTSAAEMHSTIRLMDRIIQFTREDENLLEVTKSAEKIKSKFSESVQAN